MDVLVVHFQNISTQFSLSTQCNILNLPSCLHHTLQRHAVDLHTDTVQYN